MARARLRAARLQPGRVSTWISDEGSRGKAGSSACTKSGRSCRASTGAGSRSSCVTCSNSSTPTGREALEAAHPGRPAPRDPRHCPARRHPRTRHRRSSALPPRAAWPRDQRLLVVAGMLLSGMSTSVVTPPAAAARVACSNPSHSARPGSLMWTCVSTRPGSTTNAPASSVYARRSSSVRGDTCDAAIANLDGGGAHAAGQHDTLAADGECGHRVK